MTEGSPRVAVIGSGAWGTTLALLVARSEPVTLLCRAEETAVRLRETRRNGRRVPGIELPEAIQPTADPAALAGAELVIVAVPSSYVRATIARLASAIPADADVLSVVKGLERGTLLRMTEVIAHAAGIDPARVAAGRPLADLHHCTSCHRPGLVGQEQAARLAGQDLDYLLRLLRAFRTRTASDLDGTMTVATQPLTDDEIVSLVHFIATLGEP